MVDYATALKQLQTAIIDNQPEAAIDLLGRKTPSLPARLDAYIEGYRIRLYKTVEANYPATKYFLGEEKFKQLVDQYVEKSPSYSYTIDRYPYAFADYIEHALCESKANSISRLESTIAEVLWLADSDPFIPDANFSMEQLASTQLRLRTASKLLSLATDAESYLRAFRDDAPQEDIARQACDVFVVRHENHVMRHTLDKSEAIVLRAISRHSFVEAIESVTQEHPELTGDIGENLSTWLNGWIIHGFFDA